MLIAKIKTHQGVFDMFKRRSLRPYLDGTLSITRHMTCRIARTKTLSRTAVCLQYVPSSLNKDRVISSYFRLNTSLVDKGPLIYF